MQPDLSQFIVYFNLESMNHSVRFDGTLREPQCDKAGALRQVQDKLQGREMLT